MENLETAPGSRFQVPGPITSSQARMVLNLVSSYHMVYIEVGIDDFHFFDSISVSF